MNELMDLVETSCEGQNYLGSKRFTRFIAFSRGLRPLTTLARIKCFLPINHERMNGSWWYLHILLILIRRLSWSKVKVTRSKVKVIMAFMWKKSFDYNSWTYRWILMKLLVKVSNTEGQSASPDLLRCHSAFRRL